MTGYRSGAVMYRNEEFISLFKKCRAPIGVGTPTFIQDGAIQAWNDDEHVHLNKELYNKKRRGIYSVLSQKGFETYVGYP